MGDIQWHVFAYIVSKVEAPLVTSVDRVINNFLAYIAAPLKITFVLYIALTGIRIINGNVGDPARPSSAGSSNSALSRIS